MKENRWMRQTGKKGKRSLFKAVVIGGGCGMVLLLTLTALETALAQRLMLPVQLSAAVGVAVQILSAFFGSYLCARIAGEGTLPAALICGAAYGILLLVLTGFLFRAQYQGVLKGLAIILASAAAAGILASGGKKTTGKRGGFVKMHKR